MASRTDDLELLRRVAAGDAAAFEQLYERHKTPLANFLFRMSWDRARAEELLQDVFMNLWRTASRFEARSAVSTYLYTMARNAYLNDARKSRHRKEAEKAPDRAAAPEDEVDPDRAEQAAKVKAALEELPEDEREAVVLAHYQGMPYQQIAEVQGVPIGTVKSRVHRGLQRLKEKLT